MTQGFQIQAYCETCQRNTLHVKSDLQENKTKTLGMAVVCLLTCGLALPVVLIVAAIDGYKRANQKFHCQVCGRAR